MCLTPFYAGRDAALPLLQKSRGENKHQAALYESISCASNGTRFDQSNPSFDKYIPSFKLLFRPSFYFSSFASAPRQSRGILLVDCLHAQVPARSFRDFPCLLAGVSLKNVLLNLSYRLLNPCHNYWGPLLGWTPHVSSLSYGHAK